MEYKVINTGSSKQIIPDNCIALNPDAEDKRPFAYYVWATYTDPARTVDLDSAIEGKGIQPPYIYWTNYKDLYITGRSDVRISRQHLEEMIPEYLEMLELALNQIRQTETTEPIAFIFCRVDCFGNEVPVGTSYGFQFVNHEK